MSASHVLRWTYGCPWDTTVLPWAVTGVQRQDPQRLYDSAPVRPAGGLCSELRRHESDTRST